MKLKILFLLVLATTLKAETNLTPSDVSKRLSGEWQSLCNPIYDYNHSTNSYDIVGYADTTNFFYDSNRLLAIWRSYPVQDNDCTGNPNAFIWSVYGWSVGEKKELEVSKGFPNVGVHDLSVVLLGGYLYHPRESTVHIAFPEEGQEIFTTYYKLAYYGGDDPSRIKSFENERIGGPPKMTLEERIKTLPFFCTPDSIYHNCYRAYEKYESPVPPFP